MIKKLAVLLAVLLAGLYLARAQISLVLFGTIMERQLAASLKGPQLADGLHVGLCGAGSPLPDPERSPPCTLVIAGDSMFLFDVGSSGTIGGMGFNLGELDAVFLTHFHSDHIAALGDVMLQRWIAGDHTYPLPVYGPAGVDRVVGGFNQAYALDNSYRTAHHGEAIAPTSGKGGLANSFDIPQTGAAIVLENGDLEISAFSVGHDPVSPAVGYKVSYKGRTLVISGDTVASENLLEQARGVDLLLHEGLSMELITLAEENAAAAGQATMAKIFLDIRDYHTDPEDVARLAQEANVTYLAFTHIVPMLPLPGMKDVFLGDASKIFDGPIHVGKDGDFFSLPAGSSDIETDNRL